VAPERILRDQDGESGMSTVEIASTEAGLDRPRRTSWLTGPKSVPRRAVPSALLLVLASVIMTTSGDSFSVYVYCTGLFACIGALALGLLMGTAGQLSIGNAAFLAIGAFVGVFASREGIAFPLNIVLATVAAGVAGIVVGLPALRIQGLYLALATLAAHFIVIYLVTDYQDSEVGSVGFLLEPAFVSQGLEQQQLIWTWILTGVVVVTLAMVAAIQRGKVGRILRFMKDHEQVAPCLGIDCRRYKLMVFVLSSALIGLQGALLPYFSGALSVDTFSLELAISYIAMIMIGGVGNLLGPVIGAFIVIVLPNVIPDVVSNFTGEGRAATYSPSISLIVYGLLIVVVITRSADGVSGWLAQLGRRLSRRTTPLPSHKEN
jgi:branched-chain amino acid transport system permease protein